MTVISFEIPFSSTTSCSPSSSYWPRVYLLQEIDLFLFLLRNQIISTWSERVSGGLISDWIFAIQPHLQMPMSVSILFGSINRNLLIARPTSWTMPESYPLVNNQASGRNWWKDMFMEMIRYLIFWQYQQSLWWNWFLIDHWVWNILLHQWSRQ